MTYPGGVMSGGSCDIGIASAQVNDILVNDSHYHYQVQAVQSRSVRGRLSGLRENFIPLFGVMFLMREGLMIWPIK